MIKISQLKLPIGHDEASLKNKIKKTLHLKADASIKYSIIKRSIDARKKPDLYYVYTVLVETAAENQIVKKVNLNTVSIYEEKKYVFPEKGQVKLSARPLIIGLGPAGLFSAYILTLMGYRPIVLERGKQIEDRTKDVIKFWEEGALDPASNVSFGEGGAGTFSDGKLNTGVKDSNSRNNFVLETFIEFGAPEKILYENKPHIGTDVLTEVITNMRNFLLEKGCEIHFNTKVEDFIIEDGRITGLVANGRTFDAHAVVLAIGHSSRDTFERLKELNVPMEAKQFAVGFRVEHPQEMIDRALYGSSKLDLAAAAYKVTSNFPNNRGVYSFCMCPGGYVVNASSEENMLVVNGMSYSKRDGANANSAIIVSVGKDDFKGQDPLAGVRFQREIEKKAYDLAKGMIPQQLYGDYKNNVPSTSYGAFSSTTRGMSKLCNLRGLLSDEIEDTFIQGMEYFDRRIKDFNRDDAILSGIESRTSSPVRIMRDTDFESQVKGLYPCGEGAGYAGGIMSAAMDGIKVAEAIIRKYANVN